MNTVIKLCRKCGFERSYNDYHRMCNPHKVYAKKNILLITITTTEMK